jgi:hypothetical protein
MPLACNWLLYSDEIGDYRSCGARSVFIACFHVLGIRRSQLRCFVPIPSVNRVEYRDSEAVVQSRICEVGAASRLHQSVSMWGSRVPLVCALPNPGSLSLSSKMADLIFFYRNLAALRDAASSPQHPRQGLMGPHSHVLAK